MVTETMLKNIHGFTAGEVKKIKQVGKHLYKLAATATDEQLLNICELINELQNNVKVEFVNTYAYYFNINNKRVLIDLLSSSNLF